MTAAELHAITSLMTDEERQGVEIMVARAKDDGLTIASPADDRSGWNYPVLRAERPNELLLTLRWVAENH